MKASDVAAFPFTAGAALRHRRPFHPNGVLAKGSIERLAPPREGLPIESADIVARISKALGIPGGMPDAAGLAWRNPPASSAASPWDVLLVSAGLGSGSAILNRMLLRPVTLWSQAAYSSLMPFRYRNGHRDELWWLRARLETHLGDLSLETVRRQIDSGGMEFLVEQARDSGAFTPVARIRLTATIPTDKHHDVAFDPVAHTAPGVQVWPGWLKAARQLAYRSSREGRRAE